MARTSSVSGLLNLSTVVYMQLVKSKTKTTIPKPILSALCLDLSLPLASLYNYHLISGLKSSEVPVWQGVAGWAERPRAPSPADSVGQI